MMMKRTVECFVVSVVVAAVCAAELLPLLTLTDGEVAAAVVVALVDRRHPPASAESECERGRD